jgi:hypothetical protein
MLTRCPGAGKRFGFRDEGSDESQCQPRPKGLVDPDNHTMTANLCQISGLSYISLPESGGLAAGCGATASGCVAVTELAATIQIQAGGETMFHRITLIGFVGQDPAMRYAPARTPVPSFSVAARQASP